MWEILHNKCTSTIRWRIAASGGDDACAAWLEHWRRVQCSSSAWSEWSVVKWQCIMRTNGAPRWTERHDVKTGECEANGIISDQSDSGWLWNTWMSLTVVRVRVAWVRAGPPAVSTLCRLAPPPHPTQLGSTAAACLRAGVIPSRLIIACSCLIDSLAFVFIPRSSNSLWLLITHMKLVSMRHAKTIYPTKYLI